MSGALGSIEVVELPASDAGPYGITAGPDGAVWVTMVHAGRIGRLEVDGAWTSYQLEPTTSGPSIITPGPDGALWFTETQADRIGRISTDGEVTSFPLPPGVGPFGLAAGPDGALWFTDARRSGWPALDRWAARRVLSSDLGVVRIGDDGRE